MPFVDFGLNGLALHEGFQQQISDLIKLYQVEKMHSEPNPRYIEVSINQQSRTCHNNPAKNHIIPGKGIKLLGKLYIVLYIKY